MDESCCLISKYYLPMDPFVRFVMALVDDCMNTCIILRWWCWIIQYRHTDTQMLIWRNLHKIITNMAATPPTMCNRTWLMFPDFSPNLFAKRKGYQIFVIQ